MDAQVVIFKHRHKHASGQSVSGAGPRAYYVDEDTMCLHLMRGPRKRVSADAGVSNPDDIAEFRAFPQTFQEVSLSAPPPPPAESAPAAAAVADAPASSADQAEAPPADKPMTPAELTALSVPKLKDALASGKADHLDFKDLAAAERSGRDRRSAVKAILDRKQHLAQAAAQD